MTVQTFYATGTASVNNGATAVTGAGTGWADDVVMAGDLFMDPAQPAIPPQRIASVTDGTHLVLAQPWPGTTMTAAAYEVRFVGYTERSTAQTRRYLAMLGQIAALGIQPDAFGLYADRTAYDDQAKGYIYLSLDGDAGATTTAWTLYIKLSAATADWDAGQTMEGAPGPQGDPGPAGPTGATGATGPANELTIGTVDSGLTAGAEITGTAPAQVLNLTLPQGNPGADGNDGLDGNDGWSPVLAIATDGARRVAQVVDWTGGEGTKPTTGLYVGATGLTATIGDAVDIRGPAGSGTGDVSTTGAVTSQRLARFADGTGDAIEDAGVMVADVLSRANHTGTQLLATISDAGTAAAKDTGTASGNVPVLNGSGKLDNSVIPAVALVDVYTVASQAAMLALSAAEQGDVAIRTDINKSFVLSSNSPATLADWKELLTPTDAVLSVAGLTGAISGASLKTALALAKGDVGLGNVDNTSDATKNSATATLTNKRITPRVTSITSSATPTVNTDSTDIVNITALATAITSMTTNLSGTPSIGDVLVFQIKDNGTACAITWGASFAAMGVALPTTTVTSKRLTVGFMWNGTNWGCVGSASEA